MQPYNNDLLLSDDSDSSDSDEMPRGHDPSSTLHLNFSEAMTVAPSGDPYIQHRPSPNAAPFVPSHPVVSSSSSAHGTPTHAVHRAQHGHSNGYHGRYSLSPSSVNHHDARHQYAQYNMSSANNVSPPNGPHSHPHPELGPPPTPPPNYNETSNVDAQFLYLAGGDPLPSPRGIDYAGSGAPLHLRTPRHMRMPNGTPKTLNGEHHEKRTFYCMKLLEKVQYCAYKLDSLQEKYREEYVRQQELCNNVQGLRAMSPRNPRIQQVAAFVATSRENIKQLLIEVSQHYSQMQIQLAARMQLHLTMEEESIFVKFQNYFDRFEQTQMHLVHAGVQHYSQQATLIGQGSSMGGAPGAPVIPVNGALAALAGATGAPHSHGHVHARPAHNGFMSDGAKSIGGKSSFAKDADPNVLQPTNMHPQQIPEFGYVVIGTRMSQMISQIVPALTETEQQQNHISEHIEDLVRQIEQFSGAKIVAYGSATNDLFIKGSDLNFCVKKKSLGMSVKEAQVKICAALRNGNFDQVQAIIRDNGEMGVSFLHPQTDLRCELSFNVMKEIGSSRLIRAYATIDSRFKHIAQVVKHWSLRRNICGKREAPGSCSASSGSGSRESTTSSGLTPYALVLMVINFLQQRRPPVLPILSIMVEPETGSSPWSDKDDFQINTQKYREFAAKNEESAAQLLVAFFRFYAHEFDTHNLVVSVRTGSFLSKSEKNWSEDEQPHLLSVEDPFDSNKDLCEGIDRTTVHFIVSEFMRAYRVLCNSFKIYDVCRSYYSEKDIQHQMEQNESALNPPPGNGVNSNGGSPLLLGPQLSPSGPISHHNHAY